ncbi:MAG TPA: 2-phospho-L-lactate transferase [Aeromicrobium sp.]|nr:2-phospho-L-lactate transferase [Aeromicrobium sp.]
MHITLLSGGMGGSRFAQGVLDAVTPSDTVTIIANTADDITLYGLRICPDLDTVMYTLSGGIDPVRGWGRTGETWNAKAELEAYGVEEAWFGLGDRDLATHLVRTSLLRSGASLSEATARLCERWQPGGTSRLRGSIRLLPMTDDPVETHIETTIDAERRRIHFQEFWIRHRAEVPVHGVDIDGIETAKAAPGVIDAITSADIVLIPPSNPVVSVGPIVGVSDIGDALRSTTAPIVGVSPIIGRTAVRGMANQLLAGLGVDVSATGVAALHGSRASGGILDGWLIDDGDAAESAAVDELGIAVRTVPLWMSDAAKTQRLAEDAINLARELGRP